MMNKCKCIMNPQNIKIYILLSLLLLLTACGGPGAGNAAGPDQAEPDRSAYDWKNEDWQYSDDTHTGRTIYVEKYISGLEYQLEQTYDSCLNLYTCWGSNFYALSKYTVSTDSSVSNIYYISGYEDATGEIWHHPIELPQQEEYKDAEMLISSFDILDPQEYVLFVNVLKGDNLQAYMAMHFSTDGEFLRAVDLYPAMQSYSTSSEDNMGLVFAYVDNEGRYFLIPVPCSEMLVLGAECELLAKLTWDNENISYASKSAEGEIVFERYSPKEQKMYLFMYDPVTNGERIFTERISASTPKVISEDGLLYYGDMGQLYCWDLRSGDIGSYFNYEDLGIGRNADKTFIRLDTAGYPMILDCSREKAVICKLGPEPGEAEDPIRLVSLVNDNSFVASCAIMFSQEHMEHPILLEHPEGGNEVDFRTRMMADLTAGKGADIYYVSGQDMRMLHAKGVLADLGDVLGEDLRKVLYEGALSCGVIDGQQIGLPPQGYVTALVTSDELWPEESWTLEELLGVMEEHPEFRKIMIGRRYMAKKAALRMLLLQDLPNSPFLDMDAGTCDFTNPLFIRALEIVNEAAGDNALPSIMKEGKAASYMPSMESFIDFSSDMSHMGEGFHPVGFPTEAEEGNYWNADYFLVVNARAEHRDLIDAYLTSLYSWNRQRESPLPIRNDMLETNLFYVDYRQTDRPWEYSVGGGVYYILDTKPDGSPWTEEYQDILDRAVPRPQDTYYIEDIILEEAATYLAGVKTAEQAAEIIQNRVQLYLNEQQ